MQKKQRPRTHTVKKDETYQTIAEKYQKPIQEIMQTAGIDNLKAGQIIKLPPQGPLDQGHGTTAIQPPPQVPNLPGYGGTVADYTAAGANFTGPGDPRTRALQYSQFHNMEIQTANDLAAIQAAERLAPGARGPRAKEIADAAAEARERLYGPNTAIPDYFAGALGEGAEPEYLAGYTYSEWKNLPPELRTAIQNQAANPIEGFNYWWGGEERYNPETGKFEPAEAPQTWGDVERAQNQQRVLELNRQYYQERLPDLKPEEVETISLNIQPQYGEPFDTEGYRKFNQDDKPDWVPEGTDTWIDKGMVYYGKDGVVIPWNEFNDYLNAHKKTYKDLDDYLTSPEGQKQVFLLTAKANFEAVRAALMYDDRSMLPPVITQAELDILGYGYNKETGTFDFDWNDYMTNVLNYRWDATQGAWIKQEIDDSIPLLGAGGSGGGYAGGGGYGGASDWKASSGQYLRPEQANRGRSDRRYAQQETGISPTHWRI